MTKPSDMNQFFKNDGHYCAHCVGNKDKHTDECPVPAQIEALEQKEQEK